MQTFKGGFGEDLYAVNILCSVRQVRVFYRSVYTGINECGLDDLVVLDLRGGVFLVAVEGPQGRVL